MRVTFFFFFAASWFVSFSAHARLVCEDQLQATPPVFVTPTGYDSSSEQDTVERKKEKQFANYSFGSKKPNFEGSPLIIPKRAIVQVPDIYKNVIEKTGEFDRSKIYVPVQVLSLPPENRQVQKSKSNNIKSIGAYQFDSDKAQVGDVGYMRLADMEKVDKQKDFVFIVKQDTKLFTNLNSHFRQNDIKALEPYVLKLKQNNDGLFQVQHCCVEDQPENCTDYPIFKVLNVKDKDGDELLWSQTCFLCQNAMFKDLVAVEENTLDPIRKILSHPSLGLPPEGDSDFKRLASIVDLNFVDSRGLVAIPLRESKDKDKRLGPFNSLHYGAESGDADVYLKPDVACGFIQFLKGWDQFCSKEKNPGECRIEFGDASHAYFKNCTKKKNEAGELVCANPWPHTEHTDGECLDINTSRMPSTYWTQMKSLLDLLGPNGCYSNTGRIPGCKPHEGHETHMHICFKSNISVKSSETSPNPKLRQACQRGVSL